MDNPKQPDVCPKDGDMLEQHFDPLSDGARCPTCKDIFYAPED